MNAGVGRGNLPVMVALFAAIAIFVSMLLPWVEQGRQAASFLDLMSGKTAIQVGWLTAGMLALGALLAAGAAGSRLLSPAPGRGAAKMAAAGFAATLGGFGLWFVLWAKVDQTYGWTGVQMGIGVFAGIAAAVVGLIVSMTDVRSTPRPWMASPQAGQWSAAVVATQAPASWQQSPAPGQPVPPAGPWNAASASGRISYVEGGRPSSLVVNAGDQVMVGRDADARIRLTDPKVSRRHVIVAWLGNGWSVRDLGATNPTRLLGASGTAQPVVGEMRIASGQLLVGDVLVTLFPAGS